MNEEEVNRVQVTLLNVQAMTKAKKYEIQNSIENERGTINIVALVETHIRDDRHDWGNEWEQYEQRRKANDKKGGGLLIVHRRSENIKLVKQDEENKDIMVLKGSIGLNKIKVILTYLATKTSNNS